LRLLPVSPVSAAARAGKTLRIGESDDGMLSVEILKDGAWTAEPVKQAAQLWGDEIEALVSERFWIDRFGGARHVAAVRALTA